MFGIRLLKILNLTIFIGICVWEILTYGIKPWQGILNHEVVQRVERGELLPQPLDCPDAIYSFLKLTWRNEPKSRCTIQEAKKILEDFLDQIDRHVSYNKLQILPLQVFLLKYSLKDF